MPMASQHFNRQMAPPYAAQRVNTAMKPVSVVRVRCVSLLRTRVVSYRGLLSRPLVIRYPRRSNGVCAARTVWSWAELAEL